MVRWPRGAGCGDGDCRHGSAWHGQHVEREWFDGIGEYVIDWGPGYRIYLARDGDDLIVLYGGGTKRRQQADITRAKELHAEYKARKAAAQKQLAGGASKVQLRKR